MRFFPFKSLSRTEHITFFPVFWEPSIFSQILRGTHFLPCISSHSFLVAFLHVIPFFPIFFLLVFLTDSCLVFFLVQPPRHRSRPPFFPSQHHQILRSWTLLRETIQNFVPDSFVPDPRRTIRCLVSFTGPFESYRKTCASPKANLCEFFLLAGDKNIIQRNDVTWVWAQVYVGRPGMRRERKVVRRGEEKEGGTERKVG